MLVTQKVRLYPNKQQELDLAKNFGSVRWVFNYFLSKSQETYTETKKGFKYANACKELTELKKQKDYLWLKESDSQALQQSLKNLDKAYNNFLEGRARFPKFKSRCDRQSIAYPQRVKITENGIKLPKIGEIKAKITRPIKGKIKTVTVSKTTTGKYFASVLYETEIQEVNPIDNLKITGIDLGLIDIITAYDGEKTTKVKNPRHFAKIRKNLRKKQQNLARCKKGSNNRQKARKKVAKVYEYLTYARQDFYHKLSRKLTDENQVLVFENLNVKGLKRTKLSKSFNDACLGMLVNFCQYKIERNGGQLIEVDRFFPSSQICSHCGHRDGKKTLDLRDWICPSCGSHHDRDENAAKNLRNEGIRIMAVGHTATACGEACKTNLINSKRQPSVKQESLANLSV